MADLLSGSSRPLYQRVYDQLVEELSTGVLAPGDRFPPERELCQRLDVSRVTLRRALKQLEVDGLLEPAPRGWRVAGPLEKAPNELLGFSELARARGLEPTSKVNSFQNRVPTGNFQWFMSLVSICVHFGRYMKRRFVAPSDQSG